LKTIKELRKKYKFEFRLIQGLPRREALYLMQRADIFLDQFVIGYHGMAALEAMALGKPTLCYIKPSAIGKYPTDFPIVNASPDDLAEVLEPLLKDGELRSEIGRKSRAYVEKYHDATKVAHQLVDIYQEVIKERRRRSSLCI
jgi:glycosyltransferase involved in cell wall biosynthesis